MVGECCWWMSGVGKNIYFKKDRMVVGGNNAYRGDGRV